MRAPVAGVGLTSAPNRAEENHAWIAQPGDAPIEIRFLEPDEAARLTEAIERSYGESYDAAWAYDPWEIRRRLESGSMRSIVGVDPAGDIVGHLALDRAVPDAPAGHAGQAVVDPRYRGHHLFTTLKAELASWCTAAGILGMYSEATAAHPYSQAANLALGAHETGFLLGYIPSQVSYTAIEKRSVGRRQSVALFWLSTNPAPARVVHPPAWHRAVVADVYEHNGLDRTLAELGATPLLQRASRFTVTDHADHNESTVARRRDGGGHRRRARRGCSTRRRSSAGTSCTSSSRWRTRRRRRCRMAVHDELGVFFGGIVPELRGRRRAPPAVAERGRGGSVRRRGRVGVRPASCWRTCSSASTPSRRPTRPAPWTARRSFGNEAFERDRERGAGPARPDRPRRPRTCRAAAGGPARPPRCPARRRARCASHSCSPMLQRARSGSRRGCAPSRTACRVLAGHDVDERRGRPRTRSRSCAVGRVRRPVVVR